MNMVIWLVLVFLLAPRVFAQDEIQSERMRFDFSPFVGYRSTLPFLVEPHVTGMNPRVVISDSPSYGFSFGIRPREVDLIEVRWTRQDSYIRTEEITPAPPRQRVLLDQFHGDFSHEPFIEEWPSWVRPFVMASVGATHLSSHNSISFTRFSFGIGGGIRFYAHRHFGFRLQAEWLPIVTSPTVAFVCGGGCVIHLGGTAASQAEFMAGPVFRF